MNFQEKQQEYARLIVENGAAIQKGQELVLRCPGRMLGVWPDDRKGRI